MNTLTESPLLDARNITYAEQCLGTSPGHGRGPLPGEREPHTDMKPIVESEYW